MLTEKTSEGQFSGSMSKSAAEKIFHHVSLRGRRGGLMITDGTINLRNDREKIKRGGEWWMRREKEIKGGIVQTADLGCAGIALTVSRWFQKYKTSEHIFPSTASDWGFIFSLRAVWGERSRRSKCEQVESWTLKQISDKSQSSRCGSPDSFQIIFVYLWGPSLIFHTSLSYPRLNFQP